VVVEQNNVRLRFGSAPISFAGVAGFGHHEESRVGHEQRDHATPQ